MRTSFHHQPEAQHPNFQLPTSWQADYPIYRRHSGRAELRFDTFRAEMLRCEKMRDTSRFRSEADIDGAALTESGFMNHALRASIASSVAETIA
jgi:hypothetical protein